MSGKKYKGLSRSSASHRRANNGITKTVVTASQQAVRKIQAAEKRAEAIASMCSEDRANIQRMDMDNPIHDQSEEPDYPAAFETIPPGEEGFGISHEGGEHEVFETFAEDLANITGRHRYDYRDRRDRVEVRNRNWDVQIDKLVDTYLSWRHLSEAKSPTSSTRAASSGFGPRDDTGDDIEETAHEPQQTSSSTIPEAGNHGVSDKSDAEGPRELQIEVVDTFDHGLKTLATRQDDIWPNVSLIRNGYLGSAPLHPTVAITIRTLELYRQSHRTCPRFSIQAQVRTLCHLHNVPYRRYLAEQFAISYDIYLEILHHVDRRVDAALQRDTPNWRLLNCCPPCFYRLEDEEALDFSFLCEMDGNNSLKRTDATFRSMLDRHDSRTYRTDYWVSPEEVDVYKDEVKAHSHQGKGRVPAADDDADWMDDTEHDPVATCIERWKNAGPDERKRMFAMYAECGIFLVSCRHGHVLIICDMIRSGELAKYPLALVKRLIEIFGPDIACGYDIACAFSKTLATSSIGPLASEQRFKLILGSFHGYGHNALCQTDWHPRNVKGMGRANFEGCERVFAASNAIAALTRHATRFHRHQAIEQHFAFWDQDKYAALSRFIYNHYRDALTIVAEYPQQIEAKKMELGLTNVDFDQYLAAEKKYLQSLKQEPLPETLQFDYVDALDKLKVHQSEWLAAQEAVQKLRYNIATAALQQAMNKANRQVRTASNRLQHSESHVALLENQLDLAGERWTEGSEEYQRVKQEATHRAYRKALDELERLVVQRLFELSKLNMSGTGYKLRVHIAKALQRRSDAIRTALSRYNQQAQKLVPPRPSLSWKEIIDYSFLGEFDLLRNSRMDIRAQDWAKPAHRALTTKYLELARAREEITRLNVELRRLRTSIHQEAVDFKAAIQRSETANPALASELRRRWTLRGAVNALHEHRLQRVMALPGFSGRHDLGIRLGTRSHVDDGSSGELDRSTDIQEAADILATSVVHSEETQDVALREGDLADDIEAFTDFVDSIND